MTKSEASGGQNNQRRARVFLSYKRNSEPDEKIALRIYEELRHDHYVFIDQTMLVGTRWAERIESELRQSDFLITLLSAHSVLSEMVQGEIETAYRLSKENAGRPMILPVRVAYRELFNYPLSAYLNLINWAYWDSSADTNHLIEQLQLAIAGNELPIDGTKAKANLIQAAEPAPLPQPLPQAQPLSLEMPEGTIDTQSKFYVVRSSDHVAQTAIAREGVTITIKGPRQMGKSSLLNRTIAAAIQAGKRVVFLDFQLVDKASLTNADLFFRQFCSWLTDELELDDRVDEYWSNPLGNSQLCTRYLSRYVLKEVGGPLVLAMDEVEGIFDTDFRSDFFSMLRSWHNNRAIVPAWKQLDLALVTSTEPYQLIENLNQSPFNVGEVIELADFTTDQASELNHSHGSPFDRQEERRLMALLGGHPYLVRRALYLTASQRMSVDELFNDADDDRGPFGDHLRYHLFRLHKEARLVKGFRHVLSYKECRDEDIFFRLRGAGLVRRDGRSVVPRCQLYADYFKEHLHE
ncbi:MAG TPA: AAA-like domain-containing protein, partial [Pyrinomonadaceae bacterium]|nr:AAA-like domain-containing protein [Pyrinomonadaceae bacterium]